MTIFIIHEFHKLMGVICVHCMSWEPLGSAKYAIFPYLQFGAYTDRYTGDL